MVLLTSKAISWLGLITRNPSESSTQGCDIDPTTLLLLLSRAWYQPIHDIWVPMSCTQTSKMAGHPFDKKSLQPLLPSLLQCEFQSRRPCNNLAHRRQNAQLQLASPM